MLSLYTRDEYAAFGLAALCDIERIPWRRVRRLDEAAPLLVVAGADLSAGEVAQILSQRALVLDGGPVFAARALGETAAAGEGPATVSLSEPIWPDGLRGVAALVGKHALRLPYAPVRCLSHGAAGARLASVLLDGSVLPGVLQLGACLWSALDLGTAFAHLLTERYAPPPARRTSLPPWARGTAEALYYAAPDAARRAVQRASYRALERRLARLGPSASEYPADPAGWLLIELMNALIRRAAGSVLRLERWPAGYRSAAVLTHDLEPRRYVYTHGLRRLLGHETAAEPHALGVVAQMGARHLHGRRAAVLDGHEVFCHGLHHRGEPVHDRARVLHTLQSAKAMLERELGRPIAGYRSPRLDRSADLDWALDEAGFSFDSSRPDVDRENLEHYGRGVRLNLPYRAPIPLADGRWRPSRCLELPLTAPDCIQPLFAGAAPEHLQRTVGEKAEFVRASGGLYVALVHAGVFGDGDAARREAHLADVAAALRHPDTWMTTPERVVAWWNARERLRIEVDDLAVRVRNEGPDPVGGAVLVLERGSIAERVRLPVLPPHGDVAVSGVLARPQRGANAA